MKFCQIFFFLALVSVIPVWSETIVFQSGKSLDGKILDQTSESVTFVDKKGSKSSISKKKIYKILYNASEKERLKAEESAKALLAKEKLAKDSAAAEESLRLEEERLKEIEAVLEKNKVPVGESEETMLSYKRRIGDLEIKVKEMEDFLGRQTDWRRYYEAPRSPWDIVQRSIILPGWGHIYAKEETIGTAYTSLFFTSLALYLGSKEAIRIEKNNITSDAVDLTLIQPILQQTLISITPASSQEVVTSFLNFRSYDKINNLQKDSANLNRLSEVSNHLEQFTLVLYFGQLVHSYFTGRSWANLNQIKAVESSEPVSFHFKTYRDAYGMQQTQTQTSRIELGINYQF
ncbi:MAG: hypothetical protein O9264_14860 [Leptospira sp.]|nr:hypothetical protein [Leptospira sp.]